MSQKKATPALSGKTPPPKEQSPSLSHTSPTKAAHTPKTEHARPESDERFSKRMFGIVGERRG
jgi:hypothetical protein